MDLVPLSTTAALATGEYIESTTRRSHLLASLIGDKEICVD